MAAAVDDLLQYSRVQRQRVTFRPVNMNEVANRVRNALQLTIAENQAQIIIDPLPVVFGNEWQLTQLMQNLISNGLKFRRTDPPIIHIKAEQSGDYWTFSVTDNGIGISEEYFQRIFIMFQRLHARDEYPGTGIGLAICKKIVDVHGGKIGVRSTLGSGTTFWFSIPAVRRNHPG